MRIAVTGTNGIGKSTLIKSMLDMWECYTTPDKTYRDVLTQDKYTTTMCQDTQLKVLDNMIDSLKCYGKDDNVIFDRCPIDNIVYSIHGHERGDIDESFITECAARVKESLRMLDLILFIPITTHDNIDIADNLKDKGDLNLQYATEIDHLFKSIYKQWENKESPFVDYEDKPHVIEVFGTPEQRLEMVKLYITESGGMFEDSVILSPSEIMEMEALYSAISKEPITQEKLDEPT